MDSYKHYLETQNYSKSTIKNYTKELDLFIKWCQRNHSTPETIDYKALLKFIKYLQRKSVSKRTVNHRLIIVKNYFKYLESEHYRPDNPVEGIIIKGVKRTLNHNLLSSDELEDLYYSYNTEHVRNSYQKLTSKRNKAIIGLMVYQGLTTTSLARLEEEDLQLYKGKIYIARGRKSNARELELKSWQAIQLLEYVNEIRPMIKEKNAIESNRLFIPNTAKFANTIHYIFKDLKKINNKAKNIKQIRASVITNWLKQYNLREVQELAGHRYISSTEYYLQEDLEHLHEMINTLHPIN